MLKTVPGTSSAYAERVIGGYYLDIVPDRDALARYGLMVGDVQDVVATALGGETVTTTVEGRERYTRQHPLSARPAQQPAGDRREVLVPMPAGGTVPLGEVAQVKLTRGPTTIRTENGQLAVYIFVDIRDRDLGGYVADAQKAVAANVKFPPGYLRRVERPVRISRARRSAAEDRRAGDAADHLPAALSELPALTETLIVMLSLPFALVGGLWLLWWLGFNLSVAVAVGFIALAGVAAETGVVMLIYLDPRWSEHGAAARAARADP